ncbi:hypothetical protein [uncultured Acinetobacter sp.]|uniref:hypothetical protein n=1 Tax=uncultured Acinetobacter sp. TaxID=165433 RepID=UPI00258D60B9|nr:hypothetical protein [uncultured Acinetobacter sp.]
MKTNTPTKSYDASDVSEGYALAYEQVADLSVMIDAMRNNHEKTADYVKKVYNVPDTVFSDMKRLFAVVKGLVSDNSEFSKSQEDAYQKEYDSAS